MCQWWAEPLLVGCGAFILAKKLAFLRDHLRVWAKTSFGLIKLKKLAFLHDLEELDISKESRCLTLGEVHRKQDLLEKLNVILKQEELYWKQRSRLL